MALTVLAFFAHPDDETMFNGGTLAYLALRGARVHYLSTTRGEGGEMGDPPLCTREELGRVRESELECAVQALGGASVSFLGYQDPVIGPGDELYPFAEDEEDVVRKLVSVLEELDPDLVITHGSDGEYGHPAHVLAHQSLMGAVRSRGGVKPVVYTVAPAYEGEPRPGLSNDSDRADWVLDISPVRDRKIQAAACHRTQHGLFLRHASQRLGRKATLPDVIRDEEALSRAFPAAEGSSRDPLEEFLAGIAVIEP
ncbi:MAG: PIG-L deacetylase family protein [Anaerolineales bacterium]